MIVRILLVEDHTDTREVFSRFLRRFGYEVDSGEDCRSALEALNRCEFHILLSDLGLPDGDGCDLANEAKKKQKLTTIALTAQALSGDARRSAAAGFDHYLTKPCDMNELRSFIDQVAVAAQGAA